VFNVSFTNDEQYNPPSHRSPPLTILSRPHWSLALTDPAAAPRPTPDSHMPESDRRTINRVGAMAPAERPFTEFGRPRQQIVADVQRVMEKTK
jgi:hypothetical protein